MQALDPAEVYSDKAVIDALTGRYGTRVITYRLDRLDSSNNYLEPITFATGASVSNNALADVKRTARFTILDRTGINYLKDRIKPWARLAMSDGGFVEWPLGVFLLSTPERELDEGGVISREVEAYDQLKVLLDDKVDDRYSVAAGALYTTAIATLLAAFTYNIVPSTLTLPVTREWEPGTTKLRIINDLLDAISYESLWFDETGRAIARPYQSPALRTVEYDYKAGEASVITGKTKQRLDLFDVPNKWVLSVSDPDRPALTATATNANPASPTSTVSRGRTIVDFRTEQDAADLTTLQGKVDRLAFEASQVFESVTFTTAAMPMHSNADVLGLNMPRLAIDGKYSEHSWTLPLKPGARMTHVARRVVTIA